MMAKGRKIMGQGHGTCGEKCVHILWLRQGKYEARSGQVGAMAGHMWSKGRAHMEARAGKWGNGRSHVEQGKGTYEGKSREVGTMAGDMWYKGKAHMRANARKWGQWQDTCGTRAGDI